METHALSQQEYDTRYARLKSIYNLTENSSVDEITKPISPATRKNEFRRAAAYMMGGLAGLILAFCTEHIIPDASNGPRSQAIAALKASGKEVPSVSEAEMRSLNYNAIEDYNKGKRTWNQLPEYEKNILYKMKRMAEIPKPNTAETTASAIQQFSFVLGILTLLYGKGQHDKTRARRSIIPEKKKVPENKKVPAPS